MKRVICVRTDVRCWRHGKYGKERSIDECKKCCRPSERFLLGLSWSVRSGDKNGNMSEERHPLVEMWYV